jgi:outer membrane biosynthesis protein TonB
MLITLSVIWVSGVQPVLAGKDAYPLNSAQVYQLSVSPADVPALYPLVSEQPATVQPDNLQARRLQNPVELASAVYPGKALAAGYEYEVTISFAVAGDGTVIRPHAHQQDNYGFAQSALRAVRASRYLPLHKVIDRQSNTVAMRRAFDARKWTFSPHVQPVRYKRKFFFRVGRRE